MLKFEDERYADMQLTLGPHAYIGRSVGSEMTCHQFPGYDLCFDIGGAPMSATSIRNVFITHGHEDHIGGWMKHSIRRNGRGLEPATYYAHPDLVMAMHAQHAAQMTLSKVRESEPPNIRPIQVGDEIKVGGGLLLRSFRTTHRIPCLGYSLWAQRQRLRPEFQGRPGQELAQLKRDGVDISEPFEVCEISFPGDTSLKLLQTRQGDHVRKARILLLECTFVDDEVPPAEAIRTGHVHIDHLVQAAHDEVLENEVILLTHFSARYRASYIKRAVERALADTPIAHKVQLLLP